MRSPTRFAVDGNQLVWTAVIRWNYMGDLVLKALPERLGPENHQQATNAIARGNSIAKRQKLLQPILAILGPAINSC